MKHYPFSIFVLAPFPGTNRFSDNVPLVGPLDIYDVDEGIRSLGCTIDIPLPKNVCPDGEIRVGIEKIADLKPQHVVRCSAFLTSLVEALEYVKAHRTEPEEMAEGLRKKFGHLPLDLSVLLPKPEPEADSSDALLDAIFAKVEVPAGQASATVLPLDAQLEDLLGTSLQYVYKDNDFRRLESILRGIQMLVRQGPVKKSAKTSVTLCNVDMDNLENGLRHIVRSSGERAPSLVLLDLPFDNSFASVDMLETLANFSEALQVPTVVHLSSAFFGKKDWSHFASVGYLANELETQPYAKFRALQGGAASRWLTIALPEVCVRNPYGTDDVRPIAFKEAEGIWLSPVWAVGTLAVKSQVAFGWPTRLTDVHACQIGNMAIPTYAGRSTPLDALFKEDRLNQLYDVGMAPLRGVAEREPIFLTRAPTMTGESLGFQLLANRVVGFFYDQKNALSGHPEIEEPAALVEILRARFIEKWEETGQPLPEDLVIGVAHTDSMGQVVLSIRMKPPRELVPEPKRLEFEISFSI